MLGYVTIQVHGSDMDVATRHAARLANNFFDDVESLQRQSKARDRRAMSHFENRAEEPAPRVVRAPVLRRNPPPRLSSVPPVPISTYRPLTYSSELGVTPSVPRTYYRTSRVYSETPYYLSNYSTRTGEPGRPIFSTSYTSSPSAYSRRYTYYYPAVVTGRNYYSPLATSYNAWSPEMQIERRRIQRRMDDLLDYKLPPPEYYREMRGSLRSLNDKLDEHRRLLDRYSGIDMNAAQGSVAEGIESKFQQLANRMPELNGYRSHGPTLETSKLQTQLYYKSPHTTLVRMEILCPLVECTHFYDARKSHLCTMSFHE